MQPFIWDTFWTRAGLYPVRKQLLSPKTHSLQSYKGVDVTACSEAPPNLVCWTQE